MKLFSQTNFLSLLTGSASVPDEDSRTQLHYNVPSTSRPTANPVTYTWKKMEVHIDTSKGNYFKGKKRQIVRKRILQDGNKI